MLEAVSFLWTAPEGVELAVAWFIPLIAAGISAAGGIAAKALTKTPTVDQSKFQLGAGLPDGKVDAPYFNFIDALAKQTGPTAAQPFLDQQGQFREGQVDLASMLTSAASGQGPSLADVIAEQQRQKNVAATLSAIASTPGTPNVALSQRLAAMGVQAGGAEAARQAQVGRLQEAFDARTQLGTVLGAGRAGDLQAAQTATGAESARQQAIAQIVQMAMQRELGAAGIAGQGEVARLQAAGKDVEQTQKLIGGVASGAGAAFGQAFGAPTAPTGDTTNATAYNPWKPYAPGSTTPGPWAPK